MQGKARRRDLSPTKPTNCSINIDEPTPTQIPQAQDHLRFDQQKYQNLNTAIENPSHVSPRKSHLPYEIQPVIHDQNYSTNAQTESEVSPFNTYTFHQDTNDTARAESKGLEREPALPYALHPNKEGNSELPYNIHPETSLPPRSGTNASYNAGGMIMPSQEPTPFPQEGLSHSMWNSGNIFLVQGQAELPPPDYSTAMGQTLADQYGSSDTSPPHPTNLEVKPSAPSM